MKIAVMSSHIPPVHGDAATATLINALLGSNRALSFEALAARLQQHTNRLLYVRDGMTLGYFEGIHEVPPTRRVLEPASPTGALPEYYIRELETDSLICCFSPVLCAALLGRTMPGAAVTPHAETDMSMRNGAGGTDTNSRPGRAGDHSEHPGRMAAFFEQGGANFAATGRPVARSPNTPGSRTPSPSSGGEPWPYRLDVTPLQIPIPPMIAPTALLLRDDGFEQQPEMADENG